METGSRVAPASPMGSIITQSGAEGRLATIGILAPMPGETQISADRVRGYQNFRLSDVSESAPTFPGTYVLHTGLAPVYGRVCSLRAVQ